MSDGVMKDDSDFTRKQAKASQEQNAVQPPRNPTHTKKHQQRRQPTETDEPESPRLDELQEEATQHLVALSDSLFLPNGKHKLEKQIPWLKNMTFNKDFSHNGSKQDCVACL
jgi:hypothetical protein